MVYEKAFQHSAYVGENVQPPKLKSEAAPSTNTAGPRKWREQSVEEFKEVYNSIARDHILEWIRKASHRKAEGGKLALKAKSTAPKGLHAKVDLAANLIKGETGARFRDDNSLPRGHLFWNEYLNTNYDDIYREFQDLQRASTPSTSMSALTVASPMSMASTPSDVGSPNSITSSTMDDDELIKALVEKGDAKEVEKYAVCTVRLNSILRQDLGKEIMEIFKNKMNALIPNLSDFIIDFQYIVLLTMTLFRNHAVVLENDQTNLQARQGFEIKSILPDDFTMQANIQYSSIPLPQDSAFLDLQVGNLFTSEHLSLLLSSFFGAQGIRSLSKEKCPVILTLIDAIKDSVKQNSVYDKDISNRSCYTSALTTYQVNLSNIWANNKMINALLDKLLLVLLRVHLAPKREKKRLDDIKAYKEKAKKKQEERGKVYIVLC